MKSDFLIALTQLAAERHLPRETILEAIEAALVSAFRKEGLATDQNVTVKLDTSTGDVKLYALKDVVEKVEDPQKEILLAEAQKIRKDAALGGTLPFEIEPRISSRIAAQTAKQVVLQRLRDAERELVYQEFTDRVEEIVSGVVEQLEVGRITINLGRAEAVLPREEQAPTERYRKGQRLKVYVLDVQRTPKGPEIIVSRTHPNLLKRLFELEVPEVYNGIVEIRAIAREAGFRSKVAVAARQEGVDPVGSCIGMRGNRIQNIVNELHGEKIDIVRWNKELEAFIARALSPAEVAGVELDEEAKTATVIVPDRHLSLAIGRDGQNARLAAKLTGWRLDIKSSTEWEEIRKQRQAEEEAQRIAEREAAVEERAPVTAVEEEAEVGVLEEIEAPVAAEEEAVAEEAGEVVEAEVVEPVAAEEEEEAEKVPAMSAEEELAALVLEEEQVEEEEEAEEAVPLETLGDEIWKVPAGIPDAGVIRFAEDILGDEENLPGRGRRARRSGRRGRERRGGRSTRR